MEICILQNTGQMHTRGHNKNNIFLSYKFSKKLFKKINYQGFYILTCTEFTNVFMCTEFTNILTCTEFTNDELDQQTKQSNHNCDDHQTNDTCNEHACRVEIICRA